jgi:hypothetical protein
MVRTALLVSYHLLLLTQLSGPPLILKGGVANPLSRRGIVHNKVRYTLGAFTLPIRP